MIPRLISSLFEGEITVDPENSALQEEWAKCRPDDYDYSHELEQFIKVYYDDTVKVSTKGSKNSIISDLRGKIENEAQLAKFQENIHKLSTVLRVLN
jgi:hypothetical protein